MASPYPGDYPSICFQQSEYVGHFHVADANDDLSGTAVFPHPVSAHTGRIAEPWLSAGGQRGVWARSSRIHPVARWARLLGRHPYLREGVTCAI